MVVRHVFCDSEREAEEGGLVVQKCQFQRDAIIDQPLGSFTYARCKASLQLLSAVKKKRTFFVIQSVTLGGGAGWVVQKW